MSEFSGPAPKAVDAHLFGGARKRGSLAALNKQSRGELRQKARAEFWAQKQAADQAATE